MAYDKLLQLTSDDANGVPRQNISATGTSANVRYFGKSRAFRAELRIGGAVTGTNPTLDVKVQASADGSTGWTDIGTFPQQTASDVSAGGGLSGMDNINIIGCSTPADKPYVRASWTLGGTGGPVFNGVSVLCVPMNGPFAT